MRRWCNREFQGDETLQDGLLYCKRFPYANKAREQAIQLSYCRLSASICQVLIIADALTRAHVHLGRRRQTIGWSPCGHRPGALVDRGLPVFGTHRYLTVNGTPSESKSRNLGMAGLERVNLGRSDPTVSSVSEPNALCSTCSRRAASIWLMVLRHTDT